MKPIDTDDTLPGPPPDPALEQLLRASRTMHDASAEVQERAMAIFGAARVARPATPSGAPSPLAAAALRLAQLVFDSLAPTGSAYALGLRGDAAAARQWLFTAGEHDVDLRLDHDGLPGERPWRLSGQVLGPDGARTVRLVEEGAAGAAFSAVLGESGDFLFDRLPAGRWQLFVDFEGWSLVLPPIAWPEGGG
ncbi:MAG: carboxypeptidase-like regulatory domain-containing protein [Pseudomonadota bacterium]